MFQYSGRKFNQVTKLFSYWRAIIYVDPFCKRKNEASDNIYKYITWQSYEDLSWIIFSTIGLAKINIKSEIPRRFCQRISGTDDCEHEFAGSKLRNIKPTQGNIRNHTTRRAGTRTSGMFTKLYKANTSGDQAIYTYDLVKPI